MMTELKWYVLRAIAGQERKVKSYLENEIIRQGLTDSLPQVLISTEKVVEKRNGKNRIRERNNLPGYVFIQTDLSQAVKHVISGIPGILGFLESDNHEKTAGKEKKESKEAKDKKGPVPLRQSEVNRLLGTLEEAGQEEVLEKPFIMGEMVTVMDGAFKGFKGTVEEIYDEKKRLKITVKIFGRNNPMELSYAQVEKTLE
jgi:transcriptional antiterminator NusG